MSGNSELAGCFDLIARLLELTSTSDKDKFRIVAHQRVARLIEDHPRDLVALARSDGGREELLAIEGVGPKIADKIVEFARHGKIGELEDLLDTVPRGLLEVMNIPGLGPKTVKHLWKELSVTSLADLKRVIDDGSIMQVPRMGEKTVQNIKDAMAFAEKAADRIPIGIAMPIAEELVARMMRVKGVRQCAFAGSLRRGKETIGDVDLLIVADDADAARDAFTTMPEVEKVLAKGESKCSVRLTLRGRHLQADLRLVPKASWGAALMYFTGSKEFNVRTRELALKKKMTLNEYGLYPEDDEKTPPQHRGVKALAGVSELEIFAALGLPEIPPELREERAGWSDAPPKHLIALDDIKAELHAHTRASDGKMSIVELAEAAKSRGFHTIAVTDHSKSSAIAGGLSVERLIEHIEAVHAARKLVKGITILAGSEVDILADGSLDYPDDVLARLDHVVASPHASLKQNEKTATKRLLRAIENPHVRILGHPTGRLINKREGFFPDIAAIAKAAAAHSVALEINAHWLRLDLRDQHVRIALDAGALIAIDCDVHAIEDFDHLRYGVLTARRAALTADRCINCWPAKKLHEWLAGNQ